MNDDGEATGPQDALLAQAARIERLEARVRELQGAAHGGGDAAGAADAWEQMGDRLREVYAHLEAGRTWQAWLLVAGAIDLADDMRRLTRRDEDEGAGQPGGPGADG